MDGPNWELFGASIDKTVEKLLLLSRFFVLDRIVDFGI